MTQNSGRKTDLVYSWLHDVSDLCAESSMLTSLGCTLWSEARFIPKPASCAQPSSSRALLVPVMAVG